MKPLLKQYGLAVLTAILLATAFPRFHIWPLAWVALIPLLWQVSRGTPRDAALQFWVAGWVFHSLTLQWLMTNIYWAGGWAILGMQALCMFLSVFWMPVGYLWVYFRPRAPLWLSPILLALLWHAMELTHARALTGFGWSALGYSQGINLIFAQLAALGGVSFLSLIMVLFAGLLCEALRHKAMRWPLAGAALALALLAHGVGYLFFGLPSYDDRPLKVGIFQSNFPNEMKWDREFTELMVENAATKSFQLARFEELDLVVWPEALIMQHYEDPRIMTLLRTLCLDGEVGLFSGTVRVDPAYRHSLNSSVLMGRDGEVIGTYDKVHLAPFGEYVPFDEYLPFLSQFVPGAGISPGQTLHTLDFEGNRFGPLICFEVLFAPMAQQHRAEGAEFLVVITNLSWFGGSNALVQELEIARMRSIETRLPLVHAGNTGISGVFDGFGRFEPVNAVIGAENRFYKWEQERIPPPSTAMQRRVGGWELSEPARHPTAWGPVYGPWVLLGSLGLLLAVLLILGRGQLPPENGTDGTTTAEDGSPEAITPDPPYAI